MMAEEEEDGEQWVERIIEMTRVTKVCCQNVALFMSHSHCAIETLCSALPGVLVAKPATCRRLVLGRGSAATWHLHALDLIPAVLRLLHPSNAHLHLHGPSRGPACRTCHSPECTRLCNCHPARHEHLHQHGPYAEHGPYPSVPNIHCASSCTRVLNCRPFPLSQNCRPLLVACPLQVVKGGKIMGFRCVAIVGNQKGLVGVGCAAGREIAVAVKRTLVDAKKNVVQVPLVGENTIPHRAESKFHAGACWGCCCADVVCVCGGWGLRGSRGSVSGVLLPGLCRG